jgi:hypothetical protein
VPRQLESRPVIVPRLASVLPALAMLALELRCEQVRAHLGIDWSADERTVGPVLVASDTIIVPLRYDNTSTVTPLGCLEVAVPA